MNTDVQDLSVVEVRPETAVLRTPLATNINHRETDFGGGALAVTTLAVWTLLYTRVKGSGISSRRVRPIFSSKVITSR